ncbi:hypothetical protein ACH4F6_03825 [Streptomyces sp. NPDC017936]
MTACTVVVPTLVRDSLADCLAALVAAWHRLSGTWHHRHAEPWRGEQTP